MEWTPFLHFWCFVNAPAQMLTRAQTSWQQTQRKDLAGPDAGLPHPKGHPDDQALALCVWLFCNWGRAENPRMGEGRQGPSRLSADLLDENKILRIKWYKARSCMTLDKLLDISERISSFVNRK